MHINFSYFVVGNTIICSLKYWIPKSQLYLLLVSLVLQLILQVWNTHFCNGEKHLIVSFYLYWMDVLFFISISFLMSSFVFSPSPYIHHHFSSPAFSVLHFSSFCSQSALFVFAVYIVHLFRYSWGFIFHHSLSHLIWTFIEMRLSLSCLMMFSLLLVLSRKKRMPT